MCVLLEVKPRGLGMVDKLSPNQDTSQSCTLLKISFCFVLFCFEGRASLCIPEFLGVY